MKIAFSLLYLLLLIWGLPVHATLDPTELRSILFCYHQRLSAIPSGEGKYLYSLKYFPRSQFHKLFIDQCALKKPQAHEKHTSVYAPHLVFDVKEPGYFQAMSNAFDFMSYTVGQKTDLESIIQLHDQAIHGLSGFAKGLAQNRMAYPYEISSRLQTHQAFMELAVSGILYSPVVPDLLENSALLGNKTGCEIGFMSELKGIGPNTHELISEFKNAIPGKEFLIASCFQGGAPNRDVLQSRIASFFEHYYQSIQSSTQIVDKISAIAELIRMLEVYHFFQDGNQRTYAFLLLNKLLIENGIPPAILMNPNIFDGYLSVQELARHIYAGVTNFLQESESLQRVFLSGCRNLLTQNVILDYNSNVGNYIPYFRLNLDAFQKNFGPLKPEYLINNTEKEWIFYVN